MTHKPGKTAVAKHLVELRREALASLKRYNTIADRLNFYKRYLALSKTYDVRLAGPFLVVKGGQSGENTHGCCWLNQNTIPNPYGRSSEEENSHRGR
jgi:hypothetical protein